MRHGRIRSFIYTLLGILVWACGITATLVGSISRADLSKAPAALASIVPAAGYVQVRSWWIILIVMPLGGLAAIARRHMGEPWVWSTIHDFIDGYRNYVFRGAEPRGLHLHRVTLFRRFPWWHWRCIFRWPWDNRLLPVERSGHMTRRSSTTFRIPDQAARIQHITGQVWARWETITVTNLPDLEADPSEENIREYSRRTWCSEDWIRARLKKNLTCGRSFCGIPVRAKGKEWGIIILDSRSPDSIKEASEDFHDFMGRSLAKLLERV